MADNSVRTPGSGESIRSIDRSGGGTLRTQVTQLDVGGGGATETLVSSTNPLPIYNPDDVQTAQNIAMSSNVNAVTVTGLQGAGGTSIQITGTWTGTVIFEGTVDGTNFFSTPVSAIAGTGVLVTTATANGQWQGDASGYAQFRVRCSIVGTGTAVVSIRVADSAASVSLDQPLPAGSNSIGIVDTELPAAAVLADATANPTIPLIGSLTHEYNGTNWDRVRNTLSSTGNATSAAVVWTQTNVDRFNTLTVLATTWGSATVQIQGSPDGGTTWVQLPVMPITGGSIAAGLSQATVIIAVGSFTVNVAGFNQVRANCTAFVSGTNTVIGRFTMGLTTVQMTNLPAYNTSGSATNTQMLKVGGSTTAARSGVATGNDGMLNLTTNGELRVSLSDVSGGGQPVVKIASTAAAAADVSLVVALSPNSPAKISDGTNTMKVQAASTGAAAADLAAVVAISPNFVTTVAGSWWKARAVIPGAADGGVSILAEALTTPTAVTTAQYHRPQLDAATGGLWVRPVQASFRIEVNSAGLTIATTAYTAGDTAGTEMSFANAARVSGWGGVINTAVLEDVQVKVNGMSVELWLFKAASTPAADNAAADWSDANMNNLAGIITFDSGSWRTNASNAVNVQHGLNIGYGCSATTLFGTFVLRGVPTGNFFTAVTDLRVTLNMLRD